MSTKQVPEKAYSRTFQVIETNQNNKTRSTAKVTMSNNDINNDGRDQVSLSRRLRRIKRRLLLDYVQKNRENLARNHQDDTNEHQQQSNSNNDNHNKHHRDHLHNFKSYKPVLVNRRVGVIPHEPSNHGPRRE